MIIHFVWAWKLSKVTCGQQSGPQVYPKTTGYRSGEVQIISLCKWTCIEKHIPVNLCYPSIIAIFTKHAMLKQISRIIRFTQYVRTRVEFPQPTAPPNSHPPPSNLFYFKVNDCPSDSGHRNLNEAKRQRQFSFFDTSLVVVWSFAAQIWWSWRLTQRIQQQK